MAKWHGNVVKVGGGGEGNLRRNLLEDPQEYLGKETQAGTGHSPTLLGTCPFPTSFFNRRNSKSGQWNEKLLCLFSRALPSNFLTSSFHPLGQVGHGYKHQLFTQTPVKTSQAVSLVFLQDNYRNKSKLIVFLQEKTRKWTQSPHWFPLH